MKMATYKIIRLFADGRKARTIAKGQTLEQAKLHCSDPKTHKYNKEGNVVWFDAFTMEGHLRG
jgi:hypothetical protein